MSSGKPTLKFASLFALLMSPVAAHAASVGAADLDYGISGVKSNSFAFDFSGEAVWTAGAQRSENGSIDPNNQRAGRVFVDFLLTDEIIYAAKTPTGPVTLTITVDSIGAGVSGTPYTDGLDLRFLGVSGSDRSAGTLWNTAGVGGSDQADIVATTDTPGVFNITITNTSVKSAIAGATTGQYLSFGMSNSTGVNASAPVGNSTAETYGFQMDTSTSGYALDVVKTRLIMPTGIAQTQGNTLGGYEAINMINGSGLSGPANAVNFGSVSHTGGPGNTWVTASTGSPNYYNGSNPEPQFIIDLGGLNELTAMLVWGYGGNTNEASDFLVEFSIDGGATWSLDTETVATSALLGTGNELLEFAGFHLADTVRLTITENANGRGFAGAGGDRVGLGEIQFLAVAPTPAALPAGLAMLGLAAARRRTRK